MRRLLWIALFSLSPLAGYECIEKSAEQLPVSGGLYALSLRAERQTRWEHIGTGTWVQRTRHELAETRLFYRLTARRLLRRGWA